MATLKLDPQQLILWAEAAQLLVKSGAATVATLRAMFTSAGLTEEQLDAILDYIIANARMRKARSKAIAEGA